MRTVLLISTVLAILAGCAATRTPPPAERKPNPALIDSFALGELRVHVSFFDPSLGIKRKYQLFETYDIHKRGQLWEEYLSSSALYLFEARDQKGTTLRYFCLRGNPQRRGYAAFLQLESIDPQGLELQEPNRQLYSGQIRSRQDLLSLAGLAFEHMAVFRGGDLSRYVGADLVYLGRGTRLVTYAQIKEAVSGPIARELGIAVQP